MGNNLKVGNFPNVSVATDEFVTEAEVDVHALRHPILNRSHRPQYIGLVCVELEAL